MASSFELESLSATLRRCLESRYRCHWFASLDPFDCDRPGGLRLMFGEHLVAKAPARRVFHLANQIDGSSPFSPYPVAQQTIRLTSMSFEASPTGQASMLVGQSFFVGSINPKRAPLPPGISFR